MGNIDDLLPYIVGLFNFRTPSAEKFSAFIFNQTVPWYGTETIGNSIGLVTFQHEFSGTVYLEPFTMPVFIQIKFRDIIDRIFKHLCRSRIKCRIHTAPFSYDKFDFRYVLNTFIKCSDQLQVLFNPSMRHTGGHQKERTFIEAWHKFLPDTGKCFGGFLPEGSLPK